MDARAEIRNIRSGAAALSKLLAAGALDEVEMDHAAVLLMTYRRTRTALERENEEAVLRLRQRGAKLVMTTCTYYPKSAKADRTP